MNDLVDRNIRTAAAAYDRLASDSGPSFDELDGGTRCLAFAAAAMAEDPLRRALSDIAGMETASANATVRRMAARAKAALADEQDQPA